MQKYIPLSTFSKDLFENQADLISDKGISAFKLRLQERGLLTAERAGFTREEFINFQHTLNDPSSIVFYGWIEQQGGLMVTLLGKGISIFEDKPKHLSHTLGEAYKKFISPCLSKILLNYHITNDADLRNAFSYVQLLDTDHRAVVESKLYSSIENRIKDAKRKLRGSDDEQVLIDNVKPLCSDEIIGCVNYLSRASYALKLAYIDQLLNFIRSKACTVRFANWVLKRIENVLVHDEHAYKIIDLRRDLNVGNLKVRNHAKGRTPIRWKSIITFLFVLGTGAFVFWILYFQPFSEPGPDDFVDNSSFTEFTLDERKRIDSLLQEMDHKFDLNPIEIDPMNPFNNMGADLTFRKEFENPTMERVYEDLVLDAEQKEIYPQNTCLSKNNLVKFKRVKGVKSLETHSGVCDAMIKNESDLDVLLYISENMQNGSVYSMIIKAGKTGEFQMDIFNTLFIVVGNDYQAFEAPKGALPENLPSSKFTYHFCSTDENYAETINEVSLLQNPRVSVTKFIVKGSRNGIVHLVDVHQALEEY